MYKISAKVKYIYQEFELIAHLFTEKLMQTIENLSSSLPVKPWMMKLKPLWLREKLYYKFFCQQENLFNHLFDRASIEFLPQIDLQLLPTDTNHKQIAFCNFYELAASNCIIKQSKLI